MSRSCRPLAVVLLVASIVSAQQASGEPSASASAAGTLTLAVPEIVALRYATSLRIHLSPGGFSSTVDSSEGVMGSSATSGEMHVAVHLASSALGGTQARDARVSSAFAVWALSPSGSTRVSARIEHARAEGPDGSAVSLAATTVAIGGRVGDAVTVATAGLAHRVDGDLHLQIDTSEATVAGWHHGARIRLVVENL